MTAAARLPRPGRVVGSTEPRLSTPPLRRLTRKTSLGFEAADWIEGTLGVTLLPWQRWWLIHALELRRRGGGFRFRTVITLVARQQGKTMLLRNLALWSMYTGRARLVLGVAQSLDIAREAWAGAVDLADNVPALRSQVGTVRRANGEQELRLVDGSRYRIAASSRSAGRGLSVDLLVLDELREHRSWDAWGALSKTTIARPGALTVGISNAGDAESIVLNHLRDAALSGADPALGIFEWSAPDGCDLDDLDAWAAANPALGRTVPVESIAAALATDPATTFRTEVLCQRVDALDAAVNVDAWKACGDSAGSLDAVRDRVVACLDVAPDLGHASLVAAALLDDGRVRLDTVAEWSSTVQLRADLPGLLERVRPAALGWFPGGPAAALAADLRTVAGARELKAGEVGPICQGFAEQVAARRVLHGEDPMLTAQVTGSSRLQSGDGWRFARRGAGHVDAVYAAAGAVHLARTAPDLGTPFIGLPRHLVRR